MTELRVIAFFPRVLPECNARSASNLLRISDASGHRWHENGKIPETRQSAHACVHAAVDRYDRTCDVGRII
jgi:hypothetical protein